MLTSVFGVLVNKKNKRYFLKEYSLHF